jgi:alpha-acetolactate decarboxylase
LPFILTAANKLWLIFSKMSSFTTSSETFIKVNRSSDSKKINGKFKHMHVRVAPKQEKPYPRFVEIARNQPEFEGPIRDRQISDHR